VGSAGTMELITLGEEQLFLMNTRMAITTLIDGGIEIFGLPNSGKLPLRNEESITISVV
jgi:hypothetical protein